MEGYIGSIIFEWIEAWVLPNQNDGNSSWYAIYCLLEHEYATIEILM